MTIFEDNVAWAFGLTAFAGLSTGIGSAMAFFSRHTNTKFLSGALGFSAGVMLYVSFVEILVKARDSLIVPLGETWGTVTAVAGFFGGMVAIAIIDRLVPDVENPHEVHRVEELQTPSSDAKQTALMRMGLFTAMAIAIHNFPEGLATFVAALQDPNMGLPIAIAIAIHNIPEGIAVSVPIYFATRSRTKAFAYSFASGLSEPIGALLGYFFLLHFFSELTFGVVFASVAGIMVFISLDELLPTAQEYGHHHIAIYGLMAGMAVMAISLLLFL
ncbi:MAG: zinc transporter ZupT [Okeania sp. SIO3B3]|nr:zinc transporter ZupT [Okeania sp. SIO3B3]